MLKIAMSHFQGLCFTQLIKVGMGYFNNKKAGELHTVCMQYTQSLGNFVHILSLSVERILMIIVYLCILLTLSWEMTLVSITLAIISSFFLKGIVHRVELTGKSFVMKTQQVNSILYEIISAMKLVRQFTKEDETVQGMKKQLSSYNEDMYQLAKLNSSVSPIVEIVGIISIAIIMFISSFFIKTGFEILPVLAMFLVIFWRISSAATILNQYRVSVKAQLPSYYAVFQFLDPNNKKMITGGSSHFIKFKKEVELKDLGFRYRDNGVNVLEDISFKIPLGAKIGIVGASGSGKSTLVDLLFRFYDVHQGAILVDGVNLNDIEIKSWRKQLGIVSQDIFLFNNTLRANITFAKPEATSKEIEDAARKANAHDFIKQLPEGYDTFVGDRGILLSGGQKQRIAIARTILKEPEILIFDEATSSIDSNSEKIVQRTINEVGKGHTVITIAHRLSTVRDSDQIIVLDSGRIVEQGNHLSLLRNAGTYKNLARLQNLA
jgi:subfamily B ATP-binding cassette protein MsbA